MSKKTGFKMLRPLGWLCLLLSLTSVVFAAENTPTEEAIKSQINALKTGTMENSTQTSNAQAQNLGSTLYFLEQSKKQKEDITKLNQQIANLPEELSQIQASIAKLKTQLESSDDNTYAKLALSELERRQLDLQTELQSTQTKISELNTRLSNARNLLSNNQALNQKNEARIAEINRLRASSEPSQTLEDKFKAELDFIDLNTQYNSLLGHHVDELMELDEAKRSEANTKQQLLQKQLAQLQEALNTKRLAESEATAKLAESQKNNSEILNFLIKEELDHNSELSQFLLQQTQRLNALSQDSLRIKNSLESLTQTQRNIDEQISVLQGTLALSQVINKQKNALPKGNLINDLSKSIAQVRVDIFEYSQERDELYSIDNYIANITKGQEEPLTDEESTALHTALEERKKMLDDIIRTLNNELNLSVTIQNNQQQAINISDSLQTRLQQQSFWVQSNNPLDISWLKTFPKLAISEMAVLTRFIGFDEIVENFFPMLGMMLLLVIGYFLVRWKSPSIKARLAKINTKVNKLKDDSHWYTPEAMLWTIVLAVPSTLLFLMGFGLTIYLFLRSPSAAWEWGLTVAKYWLFFATILSLLRPNGIAFRHFGMPQESNVVFQRLIKQSLWIVALLMISSVPSQVEMIGYTNDVIGQVMTIIALGLCLFVVRPLLDRGITEYENAKTEDGSKRSISLFKLLRLVLIFVPISLIVLIALGYYYTAVYLIQLLLNSYFVALIWVFGRYFAYRSLTISSRRMAYRRLQDTREKIKAQELSGQDSVRKEEESIKLSVVNQQLFRITDLIGWVVLIALLYVVWSDLISVAYYLNGVILWQSGEGADVEAITLLNLMRASLYIVITYVLVKNIAGILEVTIFSRIKVAKGIPHTVSAVLSYLMITFGSISAFMALGISWTKIQWIFTALSVGLGFGVREIFGSFVSGTILLFERPIRVGDKVTVGAYTGEITKIRLRSTTLLNSDNMEVVLPNQAFVTDRFINWTLNDTVTRLQLLIKVSFGADLKLVHQLLLQAASEAEKVMQDPKPDVNIREFTDSAIEHELLVHVPKIRHRASTLNFLYARIDELFKQHGIRIAFNQLDVHLHSAPNEGNNEAVKISQKMAD